MIYELSLSPNYVSNWGLNEAVRELLQNAIDANKLGYKMFVEYQRDDARLVIRSKGASLNVSQLVLGNSFKTGDDTSIGKYGEGFKLALLVLIRNGYDVTIFNNGTIWEPKFVMSDLYGTNVLAIETSYPEEGTYDNELAFYISNITNDEYESLLKDFPCINNDYGETVECATGYILKDRRFAGKMFVEGLYIQSDNEFRYGYNFNADIVNLDRDRKAINYWELRKLTAKSLVTGETCDAELVNAIGQSCTDIKDLESVLDEASNDFLDQYRTIFYATNGLKEKTLVATKSVMKQLKQLNKDSDDVVEGTEIQAYLIAKANDKLDILYQAQEDSGHKSDIEKAFDNLLDSTYRQIQNWIYNIKKYEIEFPEDCSLLMLQDIADDAMPYGYYRIDQYIPTDFDFTEDSITNLRAEVLASIEEE